MLETFLQIEDDVDYGGDGRHGRGGPIPLMRLPLSEAPPLGAALQSALEDLGYPICDDYHRPDATGVSRVALTVRDGRRISTNDAYLEPARERANLSIRGDVLVDRVLLDGGRAVGVVTAEGEEIDGDEVIVCAGAIHSPTILLRSGVGTRGDLPVGANLCEHASTPGFEISLKPNGRMVSADAPVLTSLLRYTSGLADAGANDMQMLWFGAVGPDEAGLTGGRLIGAVMRVFSRGLVRLRSDDPHDDPIVDFELLSDERDLVRLRDCVTRMIDVLQHPSVASVSDGIVAGTLSLDELGSDSAIDAWLTRTANDYVHAAGTCRMGRPDDVAAVVDTHCRVIGYEQLRVCDASVMPDIPRANTHLTTVAIAERLATLMR
jgi:choline dehydrogenase-like flavoprotein